MVVQGRVAQQGFFQVQRWVEAIRLEHIADAAIEALDHAIGFGHSGPAQPVLDSQLLAQQVKLVIATGRALARGEQTVRELFAVVAQKFDDFHRTGLVQRFEETARAGRGLTPF